MSRPSVGAYYPNIEALADGRISGAFREWPLLRQEAKALLARLAAREAELALLKAPVHDPASCHYCGAIRGSS